MSELLGQLGTFFSGPTGKGLGTLAEIGATGAGLAGNISADRQRQAAADAAKRNMNLTPQQLATMVSGAEAPLDRGLVQAITGVTDASLAEKGLSQAPGIIATTEAQALAPFKQNAQQMALQLVLRKLGLPAEFASTIPANANLAPLLALLFKGGGTPSEKPFQGAPFPTPPSPIPDPGIPGGGTAGTYDFGSLIPPDLGIS